MRLRLLASGSAGNSLLVEGPGGSFLVDAGLSARQLERRLAAAGARPSALSGLVLTHEHIDHIRGTGQLARHYGLPIYLAPGTHAACAGLLGDLPEVHHFEPGTPFALAGVRLDPFSVSHDAVEPVGFVLESEGARVGLATDMGFATRLVGSKCAGLVGLIVEFNHDLERLQRSSYPWHVKQRIRSKLGHLSNPDAASLLAGVKGADLEFVVLAHLSQENNTPELARAEAERALGGHPARLVVAEQDAVGPALAPGSPLFNEVTAL
ncbi:MAG: MBL fold metallo-hydrolase [Nitrospinota bacterium]